MTMAMADRGFASMDREKQRDIASKGGRAAHKQGKAHEWTADEAKLAGRKGGLTRSATKLQERIYFTTGEVDALAATAHAALAQETVGVDLDDLRSALARLEAAQARRVA
jgi:general stress protein YciG